MATAVLGLGSNLGDRLGNIKRAVDLIASGIGKIVRKSDVYETPPWGDVEQARFLNAAVTVTTELAPIELLNAAKQIETAIGREPTTHWGPRVIDIDILFYDDLILDLPDLTIPHGYLHERAFVLVPLLEIEPEYEHPLLKKNVAGLAEGIDKTGIVRINSI